MEDSAEGNLNCGSLAQEISEGILVSGLEIILVIF